MLTTRSRLPRTFALLAAMLAAPPPATGQAVQSATIEAAAVRASAGLDRLLPARAERVYRAMARHFQPARAMELVTFMDRFWRLAGNTGFDASLDRIRAGLAEAGFREGRVPGSQSSYRVDEYPNGGNGWEPVRAEVTIVQAAAGPVPERVFDPVVDYIALAINSFSTPPGGVNAPLVYVGSGADAASYASVDVTGAVVLGDGRMNALWREAVRTRGAIGVICAAPPDSYTKPDDTPEVFQWGAIPYDDKARAFGFHASRRVAERLKARLRAGAVTVKVDVETKFHPASPGRMLVAEIPGRERPSEHVVMVAHVQEPGANDDASGCATQLEMARALQAAITAGEIAAPSRTLTFVWGDEMRASREWLKADAARTPGTRYMISLDMTGEDATKTGGSFLIEKEPDPSAAWPRPSDPHTEWWGGGGFSKDSLRGSLLNDVYLAACLRRARDTGWNVQTNPYEGGSDHSVFLAAGIPAALATHFTDRYYHTNLDRADKASPAEMANVGIATGTAAMILAATGRQEAGAVVDLVAKAADVRLGIEAKQSPGIIAKARDRAAAEEVERKIVDAWRQWYVRALESVLSLPVDGPDASLQERVAAAVERLRKAEPSHGTGVRRGGPGRAAARHVAPFAHRQ